MWTNKGAPNDKPNWNEDGNYQVDPPTGFWPDYVKYFLGQFQKAYGEDIALERVWMKSEDGTNMVLNGTIHMTEPYFIYEAIEFETPKKWSFDFSCIVMGYEQTYFTLKYWKNKQLISLNSCRLWVSPYYYFFTQILA